MAEIILTAVINKATQIAANLLLQEGSSRLNSLEDNIHWLQREMRHIRSYVDDAKAKVTEGDSKVKNLIKDIEELAGDAEDIVDEFILEIESHKRKGAFGYLKDSIRIFSHASVAHKLSMEIEKIKTRVADIDHIRTTYGITDTRNNSDRHNYLPLDRRRLFLYADETDVIGLEDDFKMLYTKLLDRDLRYGVISIVGMPGLGKTTLAKKLYGHVRDHFMCSALVYVSQQPRLGEILLEIAKQVGLSEEERKNDLEASLRSLLKRERYVILLDDIWNVEIWDDLKLVLPECDSKAGSRIIITSRNTSVGRYIGEERSLHLSQPLDFEKSFELFTKRTSTLDNNYLGSVPPNLDNVGKEIVRRCGGVPLAIVVIAGMLRARERTEYEWSKVLKSMGQDSKNECDKILSLSYNDLPTTLKPCFLYFSLFPEDYEIRAFDLINMWIAEKFIVASDGLGGDVEDVAEDFLNDLASRNLIQVSRRTFQGRIARCRIHDLLYNLCVTLAKESNFFFTQGNTRGDPDVVARLKRLAFYVGDSDEFFSRYPNHKKLRAFMCFREDLIKKSLKTHLSLKLLRVLFVQISKGRHDSTRILAEIGSLSSLVYLKLQGSSITGDMPHNIVNLKHLMTLDIRETALRIAFDVLMEMKQLRHIRVNWLKDKGSFINDAVLPDLQTLIVANDRYIKARWFYRWTNLRKLSLQANFKFTKEAFSTPVAILPKLEVLKLEIYGEYDESNCKKINLSSYDNLVKLSLIDKALRIVNFGEFPANLIKLTVRVVDLDTNDITNIKRLPKLKILKLLDCCHKQGEHQIHDLSGADSFPELEELRIATYRSSPMGLKKVIVDELGAPKLNKLIVPQAYRGKLRLSKRLKRLAIYM